MPNMSDIEMVSNPLHRDVLSTESGHENRTYAAKETNDHQGGSMRPQFVKQKSILDCGFLDFSFQGLKNMNSSMVTVGAIVFVGDTSRGVLFPILSSLNTTLGGSTIDLGYLVAMFSVGRLLITAPLGYISDKYRHKLPLIMASFMLSCGATLWANAYWTNRLSVLYIAQFLMGVGSGSLGVTRSFVVEQCEPKKRTETLALITALQYAGFTVSPIVGSWLVTLGSTSNQYWAYALPAYLISLLSFWCLIALFAVFKNISAAPVEYTHSTKIIDALEEDDDEENGNEESHRDTDNINNRNTENNRNSGSNSGSASGGSGSGSSNNAHAHLG